MESLVSLSTLGMDPVLVGLELELCFTPSWSCSHCLHHAQDTCDAPHPQRAALWAIGQVCCSGVCFWQGGLCEYVKRAWLVQFGFATSKCHRAELPNACGGEGVVIVLQKDLPGYFWIDQHLCWWTERININYTLYVRFSAAVMKDVITLFSSWNINWGYWAFCFPSSLL